MRDITVLVTASGAPGTAALLRALRLNGERGVRIVGTDMSPQAVGRHFCDRFYVVPPGNDPAFADAMLDVVRRENIDAVLPQSSHDLQGLADARERFMGTTVMVSPPEAIRTANDKAETYALLERLGLRAPAWRRVSGGRGARTRSGRARLPRPPGLLQARLQLGLTRLSHPRRDRRPREAADRGAPRQSRDAAQGRAWSSCPKRAGRTSS